MGIKLENLVTGSMISFGIPEGDYWIQEKDFGTTPGNHSSTQYINLIGSHINSTALGERDISIAGVIRVEGSGLMAERKNMLNRLINPRHDLKLYYDDYVMIVRPDSSVKYSIDKYENGKALCKFLIQATAYLPLWQLKNSKIYQESKVTPVPLFPLRIPKRKGIAFGYIPAISIANVPNPGDVETGFVIRFTASSGKVTNPKITNNKTGKYIEVIVEMNPGDVVEVSTVPGSKYAKLTRSEIETDIFKAVTKRSSMDMTLNVGINDISVTAAGNASNMSGKIIFTPMWLEVQI